MISTSFWSADGKPISAEEFLNNLFGELPNLFKSEDELRTLWSNPLTRRTLLEKLDAAGFGKEELSPLCKNSLMLKKATCLMYWNMYLTAT
jgi:type I restriction enzyme R subunit